MSFSPNPADNHHVRAGPEPPAGRGLKWAAVGVSSAESHAGNGVAQARIGTMARSWAAKMSESGRVLLGVLPLITLEERT